MTGQGQAKAINGDGLCEGAQRFLQALADGTACPHGTYDRAALKDLRIVEVAEGRILCEVPVSEQHQNRYRTLHGGATATLADTISTAALLTTTPRSGVSVTLSVSYVSPMPGGEVVVVDSRVTKVGRQLATLSVEFRRKSTGQVVATATHTKFLGVADPTSTFWAQPSQRSKL